MTINAIPIKIKSITYSQMSKETEKVDKIEMSGSVDQTTSHKEVLETTSTTPTKGEEAPSPKDSSSDDINELKGLTKQLIELSKSQTEIIATQKQELNQLKEQLETLNTDYQNSKPLDRRAEVVGFFDFGKQKEIFNGENYKSERDYAARLFRDLDMEFPTA